MSAIIVAIFIPPDAVWKSYCVVRFSNLRIVLLPNIFFQILCHAQRIGVDVFRHELFLFWLFVKEFRLFLFFLYRSFSDLITVFTILPYVHVSISDFFHPGFVPESEIPLWRWEHTQRLRRFIFVTQVCLRKRRPFCSRYNRDKLFTRDWRPVNLFIRLTSHRREALRTMSIASYFFIIDIRLWKIRWYYTYIASYVRKYVLFIYGFYRTRDKVEMPIMYVFFSLRLLRNVISFFLFWRVVCTGENVDGTIV